MAILILGEHDNSHLGDATPRTLSAALEIGNDVDILIAGEDCAGVAGAAAKLNGVRKVLLCQSPLYAHMQAENTAALLAPLMADYEAFLAPATANGKSIAPRLAALLDIQQISEITAVLAKDTFERPIYAGNAVQNVRSNQEKNIITVRTTAFAPAEAGADAPVESLEAGEDTGLARFVGEELSQSDRPELSSAKIVISGGRGMGSAANFDMLERIADKLGAAVGASRAAVDAGYVSNEYQVGQTGKMVAPELYIAVGISGAIQHLAGMKESKVIVAINKDEDAPIFQIADYGLVADLFTVLPELEELL